MKEKNALPRGRLPTNVRVRITTQVLQHGQGEEGVTNSDEDVRRVEAGFWLGISKKARHRLIRKVQGKKSPRSNRWVIIYLGG